MSKRTNKRRRKPLSPMYNCYNCANCIYISNGDYLCSMSNDIVIEDWAPVEDFYSCKGKDFDSI